MIAPAPSRPKQNPVKTGGRRVPTENTASSQLRAGIAIRGGVIDDIRCVEDAETTITAGAAACNDVGADNAHREEGDTVPARAVSWLATSRRLGC